MLLTSRLFWKILLGFWLAIIVVSQLLWIGFSLYDREPPEERMARHVASQQLAAAVSLFEVGGEAALTRWLASWPIDERDLLRLIATPSVTASLKPDGARPPAPVLTRQVVSPQGQTYQLVYHVGALRERMTPPSRPLQWLKIPPPMLWIGGLGGLLFSIFFAWHLTRPVRLLRQGCGQVAQGDLAVRLLPQLRHRHDELSALAHDFDLMVERLQQLVHGREQLLHDVSHELRSPLARVRLALGLAEQSADKVPASLQRIEQETERMDRLIGELLELARAEQGHAPELGYFDLQGLVEAVVADARFEGERAQVAVRLEGECRRTLSGNAELVRRALENVVRNALRFSRAGQSVTLSLAEAEGQALICVCDEGPGIEEEKLASMFDPFVRIGAVGKGYGLGLAIARRALICQGGQIKAENRAQGGLMVTLSLPCR
ncbi:HAMP domain-containing sensor histidine kinase [Aeromonas simiae]|uniref:HAMP domain-containing sensor histidine kinase n=1 Tax=Aeromonas simiae TaxID=218936 RepID=UPI0005A6AF64|nr:ATP-binding protein [Aeromonas simiae]